MSKDDVRYFDIMLEELRDQNRAVLAYVGQMPQVVARLEAIEQDVAELKQDMKVMKAAVTDMSRQLADHELRITRLEAAQ
jgi:uncharacterized protein (DUF4213/DUF364 family)